MFKNYGFKKYIYEAIEELNFLEPTEVQREVIPSAIKNESIIVKSPTGTGKTHAFLLPLIHKLKDTNEVQVVIIVPTRELAYQISTEVSKIIKFSEDFIDFRTYVGGSDRDSEIERLSKSQPQIVVATIGKLKDLSIDNNFLNISTATSVVIDEADMVFEVDELELLDQVFSKFKQDIQFMIFSATIVNDLLVLLKKYFKSYNIIDLTSKSLAHKNIEHYFIPTKNKDKLELLVDLLNSFQLYIVLIFANTKKTVDEISLFLGQNNFDVTKITGDLLPRARKQILKQVREGRAQFIVASDIAARGIDIPMVSLVINYELPSDLDFFVHRTGRTGRLDFSGNSISFYDYDDDNYLKKLEEKGLNCIYKEFVNNELIDIKKRPKPIIDEQIALVHKKIPVPKKVKPGYKRNRKQQIDKEVKKIKRARIEDIYRRKAKKK